MRISFDMDGVLADMDTALAKIAEAEFGLTAAPPASAPGPATPAVSDVPPSIPSVAPVANPESEPPAPSAAILERLSAKQQARLWQRVRETHSFWETLDELEPGTVRRLQDLAYQRRWELLFVTQRPSTAGRTTQVQSQRWLHKHGFDLPAVYTTRGSRGHIAAALSLDVHIDDRLENAVDIASDSRAWSILVWRDDASLPRIQLNARKLNIAVVRTVAEALAAIIEADRDGEPASPDAASNETSGRHALVDRLKRAFKFSKD